MNDDLDFGATIRGFAPGQTLSGRYALDHILGQGGMGVVWLARDGDLNRAIAMKFLPEMVVRDREAIADLKRETKRSLELTHANIVRIYDFAQGPNWAGITMEHVDGDTLSALKLDQPGGCFDVPQIAPWVEQLCQALSYAHEEARVVHRDLKPNNVMLTSAGRLKVTDFGIAGTLTESVSRVSMRPSTGGTLAYMSPQQAMGEHPSTTDDIYSLGATIYDLLTGKPPFYQGDIIKSVQEKEVTPMSERRSRLQIAGKGEIPAKWEAAILACLQKDPTKRPQSIADFSEMLFGSSLSGVVKRKPAPPTVAGAEPAAQPASGRKVLVGSAAGLVVVVAVVMGVQHFRPRPKLVVADPAASVAPVEPATPAPIQGSPLSAEPTENLEGLGVDELQRLAEMRNPAAQGVFSLWRRVGCTASQDLKQAFELASAASAAGDPVGQFVKASLLFTGEGVVLNKGVANTLATKAVPALKPLAEQGRMAAVQCLAEAYERGLGVPKAPQLALALVEKPAEAGDAASQYRLGWMCVNGDGVLVNLGRAADQFQKAGNQSHAEALLNLAMMYETGKGVVKNPGTALKYWELAADHGSAIAQQNLARRYRNGDGVPKDLARALELYQKAADQENGAAMEGLAWMYALGEGVAKDPQKAIGLSQRAAMAGYSATQAELVKLYFSAPPAPPDPTLVATWESGTGTNRVSWKVDKEGNYTFDGSMKGSGKVGGSDGRLIEQTTQKEWIELSYQIQGDVLETYGPLGAVQWKRGKGVAPAEKKDDSSRKPHPNPGPSEHHDHDWMRIFGGGRFGF